MKNENEMMRAVQISLWANAVLLVIKGIALAMVNSLAIMADLGISVVALGISVLLYHAIRMSNKPADIFHNYGYGKIENVCEAIEGVILIGIALAMSLQAVMHLIKVTEIHSPLTGLVFSFLGIVINFWGGHLILKLAAKHGSPALKAEGLHFRLEGIISLTITLSFALAIAFQQAGQPRMADYIDPIATLIVSAVITIPSFRLLREAFMKLLDASIGEAGQMDVLKVLTRHFDHFCNFSDIKTRTAGRKQFVDIRLVMPDHLSVKKAHRVASALRHEIAAAVSESEVTVHIEPCLRNCAFIADQRKCPYGD